MPRHQDFLSPEDIFQFRRQRRQASQKHRDTIAGLHHQRGMLNQRRQLDVNRFNTQFGRQREQLPGQFAQRGLLNSGLYGRALQRHGQDRLQGEQGMLQGYLEQFGGLQLQRQQADNQLWNTAMDIHEAERAKRAALAAQLRHAQ